MLTTNRVLPLRKIQISAVCTSFGSSPDAAAHRLPLPSVRIHGRANQRVCYFVQKGVAYAIFRVAQGDGRTQGDDAVVESALPESLAGIVKFKLPPLHH